jgi:hypothetical protein
MSQLAGKPHAANTLRRALRNLMRHAIHMRRADAQARASGAWSPSEPPRRSDRWPVRRQQWPGFHSFEAYCADPRGRTLAWLAHDRIRTPPIGRRRNSHSASPERFYSFGKIGHGNQEAPERDQHSERNRSGPYHVHACLRIDESPVVTPVAGQDCRQAHKA